MITSRDVSLEGSLRAARSLQICKIQIKHNYRRGGSRRAVDHPFGSNIHASVDCDRTTRIVHRALCQQRDSTVADIRIDGLRGSRGVRSGGGVRGGLRLDGRTAQSQQYNDKDEECYDVRTEWPSSRLDV